jgi:hypothetical protein
MSCVPASLPNPKQLRSYRFNLHEAEQLKERRARIHETPRRERTLNPMVGHILNRKPVPIRQVTPLQSEVDIES